MEANPVSFEAADVRIARGFWPIAQHGRLAITRGEVMLCNTAGAVIATAPVGEVTVRPQAATPTALTVTIGGAKYTVDDKHVTGGGVGYIKTTTNLNFVPTCLREFRNAGATVLLRKPGHYKKVATRRLIIILLVFALCFTLPFLLS